MEPPEDPIHVQCRVQPFRSPELLPVLLQATVDVALSCCRSLISEDPRKANGVSLSIQYFSNLERLRLAQDGGSQSRPSSRLAILPPSNPLATPHSSGTDAFANLSHAGSQLNRHRSRRRRCSAADITPSTVAWFSSLPPAVQKKLFSKEECSFYSQEQERTKVILDAADETLRRRSWHPIHFAAFARRTSDDDDDTTIVGLEDLKDDDRIDSPIDMANYSVDDFRWLEDDGDLDLRLDDYHEAIAETTRRTTLVSEATIRLSRPNTALSGVSIRRGRSSTSSSQLYIEPLSPPARPSNLAHSRASSFSFKQVRPRPSIASIDPRATHYQDPAARLKLRLYLASPQKFDEAIEFGFPSVEERDQWSHKRPKTSPQQRSDINRTFFNEDDDTPSLSGDEGDDAEEPDTLFDPRTPDEPLFHIHRASQKPNVEANVGIKSVSFRRQPETYARGIATDREMTLHMTLTRPDLRSPEEVQSESLNKVSPPSSKRPELVLVEDPSTIWDSLPAAESKMKRFLRRLMLK